MVPVYLCKREQVFPLLLSKLLLLYSDNCGWYRGKPFREPGSVQGTRKSKKASILPRIFWNNFELWFSFVQDCLSTWYTFIFLLNFRGTKSSNLNNNQTDYSNLSDSQFLFGSQFCPESSQTLSTALDSEVHLRHPKQSQQNSLDVSLNSRISLHMFHSHYGDKL